MALPAALSTMIKDLKTTRAAAPVTSGGDMQFLKMDKTGEWVFGAEATPVSADSVFVIDPMTYVQGFVAWDDGTLVDEKMNLAGQPPLTLADLPDVGARWDAQVGIALKGVEGKDTGVQLIYKASSKGGKEAIGELMDAIIERGEKGEVDLCALVVLETSHYRHKKYGKIFTPVLDVDGWTSVGADPVKETEPEPEPKAKAVRRRRKAAA